MKTLQKRKDLIRESLDFDQISEVRAAVKSRIDELEKLEKKEAGLGIDPFEIRRRLAVLKGDDTTPGLLAIIRPIEAFQDGDQQDAFYDGSGSSSASTENGKGAQPAEDEEIEADYEIVDAAPASAEEVITLLLLVEDLVPIMPTEKEIAGWKHSWLDRVAAWAGAVHLYASDNNDVEVPPMPLILLPTAEQIEEARAWVEKHGWDAAAEGSLQRVIDYVYAKGWGAPRRPAAGDPVRSVKDARRKYRIREVLPDGKLEIEDARGTVQHPYIELIELDRNENGQGWKWVVAAEFEKAQ